jgi:hypothetical protein
VNDVRGVVKLQEFTGAGELPEPSARSDLTSDGPGTAIA